VKPEISETRDEIRYAWPEVEVVLIFDRLHETESGAVRGMLTVDSTQPANGHPGHLFWSAVTLTTITDRKNLVSKLDKLVPQPGSSWEPDVDRCFQDCYQRHVAVSDPVLLTGVENESALDTDFLIDPLIPLGQVTLLLADQGSTKSYLMLYLAACVALGVRSCFGDPKHCGPVIYFDWEVDEAVANKRLAWICRGLGSSVPSSLHYVNMSTRGRIFDRIREMRQVVDRLKPVLVIIDSLTFATGADLNSAEYAAPTMSAVGSLGEGVSKLISAHPNKTTRNARTDDISVIGSALFEYRARAIWHMQREKSGPRATRFGVSMTPRKAFDGPPQKPLAYTMDFDNVQHTARFVSARLSEMPSLEVGTMSGSQRIRRALGRAGRLDTAQLADVTGMPAETVKMECNRMSDVFPIISGGGRGKPTVWALKAEIRIGELDTDTD
jgi:hypothetical protein